MKLKYNYYKWYSTSLCYILKSYEKFPAKKHWYVITRGQENIAKI
mgnify:CR=1 FL=1